MRLLGFEVQRTKGAVGTLSTVNSQGSWLSGIRESFTGAWQRNVVIEPAETILSFSAVYACVTLIADDIAKMRIKLMQQGQEGIWEEAYSPAFSPVLTKPNKYQTRIQFLSQWIVSKLLHGNAYVLKARDGRGVVTAMYVLDPRRVTPLVSPEGEVYYRLKNDLLSGLVDPSGITVPASAIIHDRTTAFFHPLVGISPIYACGMTATQGLKIQQNSATFFENMSRPSGILTAPGNIPDEMANRLKRHWEENFTGGNVGRLAVLGNAMAYQAMTIPANDAQLIEQLRWTVEDVARCFHVPLHKIASGQNPTFSNIGALNQDYYTQTLQTPIESIELLLDEGLGIAGGPPPQQYGVELDIDCLLRMDPLSRADTAQKLVGAGIQSPNEARYGWNLPPVVGGESPMVQQQNYSLAALAKRDAKADPFGTTPTALPAPETKPAADPQAEAEAVKTFFETITKGLEHV